MSTILALPLLMGARTPLADPGLHLKVLGAKGDVVTNALVCCGVYSDSADPNVSYGYPAEDGYYTCSLRRAHKAFFRIAKEGYYGAYESFQVLGEMEVAALGQAYCPNITRTVALKPIRNAGEMKTVQMDYPGGFRIPVLDQWVGFDFMKSSWCPPYGDGVHADVLLRFSQRNTGSHFDFTYGMDISFTNNPHAGFYILKKDLHSELRTVYRADPSAMYTPSVSFVRERLADGTQRQFYLKDDSYCVFRTRTKVDRDGRLVSAHYGVIQGRWSCGRSDMSMGEAWINPVANDTNLECDEIAKRSQKATRVLLERKGRSTSRR